MAEKVGKSFKLMSHSDAQRLIELPDEEYEAPDFPIEVPVFDKQTQFGHQTKKQHFYIDEKWTFINHGAFGCVLREALETAQKWQCYTEAQPLCFMDRELLPRLVHVTRRVAKLVGAKPCDLVLIPNATTGTNSVVRSLKLLPGDKIYCLSTCYYAVLTLLEHVCRETGAVLNKTNICFPITKEEIIQKVTETLEQGTKLAIFSHIPSTYPIMLPMEEIVEVCHSKGVPILIDGAHALGNLPLNLSALQADFYVANAHKWMCAPKGTAFLYVAKEHQSEIKPTVISGGMGRGFAASNMWTGLRDYSPFLALHTVLDFWETVGPDRIREYNTALAREAAEMLVKAWNTGLLVPAEMFGPMILIRLPDALLEIGQCLSGNEECGPRSQMIQNRLHFEFNVEVQVKQIQKRFYVRISAHIHNEMRDYEVLRDAILSMVAEKHIWRKRHPSKILSSFVQCVHELMMTSPQPERRCEAADLLTRLSPTARMLEEVALCYTEIMKDEKASPQLKRTVLMRFEDIRRIKPRAVARTRRL